MSVDSTFRRTLSLSRTIFARRTLKRLVGMTGQALRLPGMVRRLRQEGIACPLCGNRDVPPIGFNWRYLQVFCARCEIAFVTEPLSGTELAEDYQEAYFDTRYERGLGFGPDSEEEWRGWMAGRDGFLKKLGIASLEARFSDAKRALEIGCAEGRQLEVLAGRGWIVRGIEIGRGLAELGQRRGLDIECTSAEDVVLPDDHFGLVVMSHVIEHLVDPLAIARKCWNALRMGGWLVLETPVEPDYLDPYHLFFFSSAGLDRMCATAGFLPVARHYVPVKVCWPSRFIGGAVSFAFNRSIKSLTSRSDGPNNIIAAYEKACEGTNVE
jgi:2-polyprenyl-3-methyl-5-hydroxy-6-metoxy-1,4-benzoquinol methylase